MMKFSSAYQLLQRIFPASAPIVLLFAVDLSESFLYGGFFAMIWFVARNYGALAL